MVVNRCWGRILPVLLAGGVCPLTAFAQIDPVKRELIEFGYNSALEGHSPLSAYAFYYRNQPGFLRTNLTLRLAVAPTYLDSELGISHVISENTDLGIGVAGGGFADNYRRYTRERIFPASLSTVTARETSLSLYQLFNPGQQIPLNGLVRGTAHFSTYEPENDTASNFQCPRIARRSASAPVCAGAGKEPVLFPALAMELSAWYEGQFRTGTGTYGYDDRSVVPSPISFGARRCWPTSCRN